jgi:hypothetical protein
MVPDSFQMELLPARLLMPARQEQYLFETILTLKKTGSF